ncbi:fructose-1,6-bisphosphatase [Bradyrhizobium japonicum]
MHLPEHEELTFAIGDIHGCFDKLTSLLAACEELRGERSAQFVLVGDYIDRGPQSREVMDFLVGSEGEAGPPLRLSAGQP